jgi:hypothetical protein
VGGLTGLVAITAVAIADMLPLAHGIYVRQGIACRGASNIDTLSYWGGDGGLNSQSADCRVTRKDEVGPTYRLAVRCRDIRGGGSFRTVQTLRVESRTAFRLYGEGKTFQSFRYCGPKVQF